MACHEQLPVGVTRKLTFPPLEVKEVVKLPMSKEHVAPACVTVWVRPAIVSVPVREVLLVLASTEYVTVPLPAPVAPVVTLSQELLLMAAHGQFDPVAVTATLPVEAVALTEFVVGDNV